MKKDDEMTSLNEALFSLDDGNLSVEELDQRLELAIGVLSDLVCGTFVCGTFTTCGAFGCGTFRVIDNQIP